MQALIVCGGSPPSKNLLENEIKRANLTIGADSGGYVYIGFKHLPDVVIGDLDSFKYPIMKVYMFSLTEIKTLTILKKR